MIKYLEMNQYVKINDNDNPNSIYHIDCFVHRLASIKLKINVMTHAIVMLNKYFV